MHNRKIDIPSSIISILCGSLAISQSAIAEENTLFDEVVVSATRTEQEIKDVSNSISTVSSEEMDKTMATNVQDALKYTPGVSANGGGRFGLSGFTIRGMSDDRIKMLIDGVQQATPYNPGSRELRKYPSSIEIDTLQAIEINKGPSSTLYGADALGGTVLMRTKNPEDLLKTEGNEDAFEVKTGYQSVDESFKTTTSWARRQDQLETLLMLTYKTGHETSSYYDNIDTVGPDRSAANPADAELGNILAKAYYQINDAHRIGTTLEFYQSSYDEYELDQNGYTMDMGDFGTLEYDNNYSEDQVTRLRIGVDHEWQANTLLFDSLSSQLNVQTSKSVYRNYDTSSWYDVAPIYSTMIEEYTDRERLRRREANDDSVQLDMQFDKLAELGNSYHQFTYGVSFRHNAFDVDNTDYTYGETPTVESGATEMPDASMVQYGIFLQDQAFLFNDDLVITTGIRYDSYEAKPETDSNFTTEYPDNKDNSVTAKLGTVYHFNDNFSLFGQVSQGFKAPTIYDLYYFYDMGVQFDANPNLKAETSLSYEAGFRTQNESIQLEFTTYYNDYDDFINDTYIGETADGREHWTKENIDSVEIYGAELSSTINLNSLISAPIGTYTKLSVAYTDGQDKETGESIDSIAPLSSNLGLGYDDPNNGYGGVINLNMVAAKEEWSDDNSENVDVAGYATIDISLYYNPTQDLTIRGGVFNLLDKEYWLYNDVIGMTSTDSGLDQKSQSGRNWGVDLSYAF